MSRNRSALMEITGKAASSNYGMLLPASFGGKTTLQLYENRIVEKTKKPIATRHCVILLTEVDSVEILEEGISWLLWLGVMTLFAYGIGLIFLILYFVLKYKYFVVRSGNNLQVLCISSGLTMDKARSFMYEVLAKTDSVKTNLKS